MDLMTLVKAVLSSPQMTGMIIAAISKTIQGVFAKAPAAPDNLKFWLHIVFIVLSGLATLLDQYLNGSLGSITAQQIGTFLNVYVSVLASHFVGDHAGTAVKARLARNK